MNAAQEREALLWGMVGITLFAATLPMTRLAVGTPEAPLMSGLFIAVGRAVVAGVLSALFLWCGKAPLPPRQMWATPSPVPGPTMLIVPSVCILLISMSFILLADFLAQPRPSALPFAFAPSTAGARETDRTYLFYLDAIGRQPTLGADASGLAASASAFADWLNAECFCPKVWLPELDLSVDLRVSRIWLLKIVGDANKHNFSRLDARVVATARSTPEQSIGNVHYVAADLATARQVVAAVGKPEMITGDMLKPGCGWLPTDWLPQEALRRGLRTLARAEDIARLYLRTPGGEALYTRSLQAKGAKIVRTTDAPPLLNSEQFAAVEQKTARFMALSAKAGDAAKGKTLVALCQACHVINGQGGLIGPNLSGAGAMGMEAVIRNIIEPNAAIEAAYRIFQVKLKAGEVIEAFYVSEDATAYVIRQAGGADRRVPKAEVASAKYLRRSLMPEGLLDGFIE